MSSLKVLMLEDSREELELIQSQLRASGLDFVPLQIATKSDFIKQITLNGPDLILSDYSLKDFSGLEALRLLKEARRDTPFIFVTRSQSEETAAACIQAGAADYVLKTNLKRLAEAIRNAIHKNDTQRRTEKIKGKNDDVDTLAPIGIYQADVKGNALIIHSCNQAFAGMIGFNSPEEALNTDIKSFYYDPTEANRLFDLIRAKKKLEYAETKFCRRNGKTLYVMQNLLGKFNERNELIEVKGYIFDDTRRKELEHQLMHSQKMESLGTLAGGIAHDFNNILSIILGHTELLKTNRGNRIENLEAVVKSVQRGALLVRKLLTFAKKSDVTIVSVAMNVMIQEVTSLLSQTFPKVIEISSDLSPDIPPIVADATKIDQLLLNLCVNARDAMPGGGKLVISTRMVTGGALRTKYPDALVTDYVHLTVADTGIGMNEETRKRIFEPFFTTKERDRGTGLGLSTVYGIVTAHHGIIDVESEPAKGTTFHIYLPLQSAQIESRVAAGSEVNASGGTETIMVIDDEALLCQFLDEFLKEHGYKVVTAKDADEAFQRFRDRYKEIDLVLSDFGLPKMNGDALYTKFKNINPNVKVILASGYMDPEVKNKMLNAGVRGFLQKPYFSKTLLKTIRETLDN